MALKASVALTAALVFAGADAPGIELIAQEIPLSQARSVLAPHSLAVIADPDLASRLVQTRIVRINPRVLESSVISVDGTVFRRSYKHCTPDTCGWAGHSEEGLQFLITVGRNGASTEVASSGEVQNADGTITRFGAPEGSWAVAMMKLAPRTRRLSE